MTKNTDNNANKQFKEVNKAKKAIKRADARAQQLAEQQEQDSKFKLNLTLRAEDSLYFDVKKPSTGRSLKDDGYQAFATAPKAGFIPNFRKLAEADSDIFGALGSAVLGLDKSQLRILSVIINNSSMIKNHSLDFGQPVYINLSAPHIDYLDCYFKAHVIGVESAKPDALIHICGNIDSLNGKKGIILSVPREALLTKSEFKKLAKKLKKEDRINTPKAKREKHMLWEQANRGKPTKKTDIADVPTIDTVPTKWLDSRAVQVLDPRLAEDSSKKAKKGKKEKAPVSAVATKRAVRKSRKPVRPSKGFSV
ncbi:hypothetical protein GR7B_00104 [Vibrio phage vB_VcorM_GR7B]|nr:hypothetical protein GR7B_00104 [Vibrio phage vB_VcorM_GR7B]